LKKHVPPNLFELTSAGGWTLVGLAQDTNRLIADFRSRIASPGANPYPTSESNSWIEAEMDLNRLGVALGRQWTLPSGWPAISLTIAGDGTNVRTHAQMNFAQPLGLDLQPWTVPTNLVSDPLINFTAAQGVWPVLGKLPPLPEFKLKSV